MNIAKHWRKSKWRQLLKKRYLDWMNKSRTLLPVLVLASLIGTYLDLYFVGKSLYAFPIRPWPSLYSINIAFTLIGLPLVTGMFFLISRNKSLPFKAGLILMTSLLMTVMEKISEKFGYFVHDSSWRHEYSFLGYLLFLTSLSIIFYLYAEKTDSSS